MLIVFILFLLAILILMGALLLYLFESFFFQGGYRAVYMGSNLKEQGAILDRVVEEFIGSETEEYCVVEPGAGLGTVTRYLVGNYRWKAGVAIELRPTVYWAGKLLARKHPLVRYRKENLFQYPYEPKSLVYCYLTSTIITRLHKEGAFRGSLVVCLTFPIQGVEATKKYPVPGWQGAIRVYDFRQD